MFKEYLREVKEAVINSKIFDRDDCEITLEFDKEGTCYNNLPVRSGRITYGGKPIADIHVSVVNKPKTQFYEDAIHNSVGGFDAIDVSDTKVYYMVGCWRYGYIPLQIPLSKYEAGSNFILIYHEYLKNLERIHKEEYDDEFEESD